MIEKDILDREPVIGIGYSDDIERRAYLKECFLDVVIYSFVGLIWLGLIAKEQLSKLTEKVYRD